MPSHGTFQPIIIRGAEDGRAQQRSHARAALSAVIVTSVLLLYVATTSDEQDMPAELEASDGGYGIKVSKADIDRLGLKAPSGFEVPTITVTDEDLERYGLKPVNTSKHYVGLKVTAKDMDRYGLVPLSVPAGDGKVRVTKADVDRFGLTPPVVHAGGDGKVKITPEDVERFGLEAPHGERGTAGSGVQVTAEDKEMYGLIMRKVEEEEAKRMGLQEPLSVSDEERQSYGMDQAKVSPGDVDSLGLNETIRVSAAEAEALGLDGPLTVTRKEAKAMGLLRTSKYVTDEDVEKYGLKDPEGWKAEGAYVNKPGRHNRGH